MNRAYIGIAVALGLAATHVQADAVSKREKLLQLVELQGMTETIAAQLTHSREQILAVTLNQVAEMQENFPTVPPEYWDTYEAVMAKLAADFERAISPAEAASLWAELYGQHVSESELDDILAYWHSPVGRKDLAATRAASPEWQAAFSARTSESTNAALSSFQLFLRAELEKLRASSGGQ